MKFFAFMVAVVCLLVAVPAAAQFKNPAKVAAGAAAGLAALKKVQDLDGRVTSIETAWAHAQQQAQAGVRGASAKAARLQKELDEAKAALEKARANVAAAEARARIEPPKPSTAEEYGRMLAAQASANDPARAHLKLLLASDASRFGMLLPTEDPIIGLVRHACPSNTVPEYMTIDTDVRFTCRPINPPALTVPMTNNHEGEDARVLPLWAKYGLFVIGGAAAGISATYGVNAIGDGETTASMVVAGTLGGAVIGGIAAALTEL